MLRLLAVLLLLLPGVTFGQTVKMPPEVVATGKLVLVTPEFDPKTPLAVKFVVFGDRKAPEYATIGNAVLVAEPDQGDEVTVVCYALFEGNKLSDAAVAKVKPRQAGPGTPPGPTPGNPPPPTTDRDIPATATGFHAILVVDPNNTPAGIAALARGENAVTKALAQRKSYFYVRNSTDSLVTSLQTSMQGKALPVLVVINSNRQILGAVSLAPADQTEKRIITHIANLVSR